MHKTIKYYNDKFDIDGIQFPNSIVKTTKPSFACEDEIKELFYKEASGQNQIVFKDDSIKNISDFDPFYNELILLASYFEFEYKEILFKETQIIIDKPLPIVDFKELFAHDITAKKQSIKIKIVEELIGKEILTDKFYFNILDRLKKTLLIQSDWTQLPDVQSSFSDEEKQSWIMYRLSLRNLDNVTDPLKARLPKYP